MRKRNECRYVTARPDDSSDDDDSRLPDTLDYAAAELASCLVTPSARAYGSEGSRFSNPFGRSQLRGTSEFVAP